MSFIEQPEIVADIVNTLVESVVATESVTVEPVVKKSLKPKNVNAAHFKWMTFAYWMLRQMEATVSESEMSSWMKMIGVGAANEDIKGFYERFLSEQDITAETLVSVFEEQAAEQKRGRKKKVISVLPTYENGADADVINANSIVKDLIQVANGDMLEPIVVMTVAAPAEKPKRKYTKKPKADAEPVVDENVVTESVVAEKPKRKYTKKPKTETVVETIVVETIVTEPVVETIVTEPVVETIVEPVVETIVEPVVETIVTEPVVEPVVKPVVAEKPKRKYTKKPKTETVVEPVVETIVEPVVETIVEPVVETVVEPVVETVVEPVVETVVEKPKRKYTKKPKTEDAAEKPKRKNNKSKVDTVAVTQENVIVSELTNESYVSQPVSEVDEMDNLTSAMANVVINQEEQEEQDIAVEIVIINDQKYLMDSEYNVYNIEDHSPLGKLVNGVIV